MASEHSNEKDIRNAMKKLILNSWDEVYIMDEFCGGSMRTRADLGIFAEETLIMVEIKSDRDILKRLENQVKDYMKYSTSVYVIVDISHKEKLMKYHRDYLGFSNYETFYYDNGKILKGDTEITKLDSYMKRGWNYKKIAMLELLWREEKKQMIGFIKGRSKVDSEDAIKQIYTFNEIYDFSIDIIYDRVKRNDGANKTRNWSPANGRYPSNKIKHKDYKQILFNELIECKKPLCKPLGQVIKEISLKQSLAIEQKNR